MSQTETLMLVALGFVLAAIMALFIGRFAWGVALRLGARRMQRQVPSTVAELQSERDRLRAEYAMLSRKLDMRLSDIKMRMAEQMAEVTRNRNRVETLSDEVKKRDAELDGIREKSAGLEAELGEMTRVNQSLTAEVERLKAEIVGLNSSIAERDQRMATLDSELAMASNIADNLADPLSRKIDELTHLSEEIAGERSEAKSETADLEQEMARLDRTWSEQLTQLEKTEEEQSGPRTVSNIVSLAKRLKALQKGVAS